VNRGSSWVEGFRAAEEEWGRTSTGRTERVAIEFYFLDTLLPVHRSGYI